jgi:hypothetical protein
MIFSRSVRLSPRAMTELSKMSADYRDEARRLRAAAGVADKQVGQRLTALVEVFEDCAKSKETICCLTGSRLL